MLHYNTFFPKFLEIASIFLFPIMQTYKFLFTTYIFFYFVLAMASTLRKVAVTGLTGTVAAGLVAYNFLKEDADGRVSIHKIGI